MYALDPNKIFNLITPSYNIIKYNNCLLLKLNGNLLYSILKLNVEYFVKGFNLIITKCIENIIRLLNIVYLKFKLSISKFGILYKASKPFNYYK